MILGRSNALWLAVLQAALNVAVIVFGLPLTLEGLAALNVFGVAVIGLVANQSDPTTAGTFALTTKAPAPATVAANLLATAASSTDATIPPTSSGTGANVGGANHP